MDEPQIKKHPTEIFGHTFFDKSILAKKAITSQYCPFIKAECNKPRKSEPKTKIGICSVGYKGNSQKTFIPVIICPNRFLEDQVFESIKTIYLTNWNNIQWVNEVSLGVGGSVDYVAISMDNKAGISDFLCIEFQAGGTTGTPWQAVIDLKKNGKFSTDNYNYGINWANEFMKTMMQQVYKKGKIIKLWGKKIIFVVQDVALDYLNNAVDTSDIREANEKDEVHFLTFKMVWVETAWHLKFSKAFSTNLEGINKILGGAHEEKYPSLEEFKANIYRKGKKDGVF